MPGLSRSLQPNAFVTAIIASVTVLAAGTAGNLATFPNLRPWYASLVKPAFNPPNWIFGPVWGVLYIMMAIAFWRILRKPVGVDGRRTAIVWFVVQMALNAAWSIGFFGLHNPLIGLAIIVLMLAAIVMTILSFVRLDSAAALLLAPYLAWVSFATLLNAAIWQLNP